SFEIDGKEITGKKAKTSKPGALKAGLILSIPLHPDLATKARSAARAKQTEGSTATLSLAGITDGDHVLKVVPPPGCESTAVAGAALTTTKDRMYRPLSVKITLKDALLTYAHEIDPADPKA